MELTDRLTIHLISRLALVLRLLHPGSQVGSMQYTGTICTCGTVADRGPRGLPHPRQCFREPNPASRDKCSWVVYIHNLHCWSTLHFPPTSAPFYYLSKAPEECILLCLPLVSSDQKVKSPSRPQTADPDDNPSPVYKPPPSRVATERAITIVSLEANEFKSCLNGIT